MFAIVEDQIDVSKILEYVKDESCGATVFFLGTVRDHNDNTKVSGIYYEAYKEMAKEMLRKIECELIDKWSVRKFVAIHRVGELKVGEISVITAVCSEHRKEAFEACKYAIDTIKKIAPIWKKERSDLGEFWVKGVPTKGE